MSLGKDICVSWKDFCFLSISRLPRLDFTKDMWKKFWEKNLGEFLTIQVVPNMSECNTVFVYMCK